MIRGYIEPNHGQGRSRKSKKERRLRQEMFNEQKGLCFWCGLKMQLNYLKKTICGNVAANQQFATFEHLTPRSVGGTKARSNLVLAHSSCNNKREKKFWPHDPFYSIPGNRERVRLASVLKSRLSDPSWKDKLPAYVDREYIKKINDDLMVEIPDEIRIDGRRDAEIERLGERNQSQGNREAEEGSSQSRV